MKEDGRCRSDQTTELPTRSYEGSSVLGASPHTLLQRTEELLLFPTLSPTRGGQAELPRLSCCSSQGRNEAENCSAAVLQTCFNADLNCL